MTGNDKNGILKVANLFLSELPTSFSSRILSTSPLAAFFVHSLNSFSAVGSGLNKLTGISFLSHISSGLDVHNG